MEFIMDDNIDINSIIKSIPLFFDLQPTQLDSITQLSDLIEIDPGDKPIEEGGSMDFLYILLEGEVKVTVLIPTIGTVETCTLGPLDILGWSAMTPIVRQRTGTVTAVTHCWLLRIDSRLLCHLCEYDHDIGFVIYRRIANVVARSFLTTRLELMNTLSK
jgi:CRP-like cAMP-binding protein